MDEHEPSPLPLNESVWPPAPLRDDPLPLSLRLEGMQLTRSGDRLAVLNLSIRRLFFFEVCILLTSLLSPLISFLTSPFHHATRIGLLPYMISGYRVSYWLYLFVLCLLVGMWWLFTSQVNLSGAAFDKRGLSVKVGGRRARAMSSIEAVLIKPMLHPFLGTQHSVSLLWSGVRPVSRWRRAWTVAPGNRCFLGCLRHEAHAEEVAAIIARFIGVPVQRETMLGTRPVPTHSGTRP